MCNTCVIMFLKIKVNLVKYKRFKDGKCTYKNTSSSHLNKFSLFCPKPIFPKAHGDSLQQ